MNKMATMLFAPALILACGRGDYQESEVYEAYEDHAPPTAKVAQVEVSEEITSSRKLIKDGYLRFETGDLDKTHTTIIDAIKKYPGSYIGSDAAGKGYQTTERSLEVRIPAASFDAFLAEISKDVKQFDQRSITVRDVTEQYFDLEARLNTKKELEARYLQLLQKASTVKDIIEIEKEIANLRSDIEVMEGRLRLMDNQVTLATLRIEFYVRELEPSRGFGFEFKNSFKRGWENLLGFMLGIIHVWPFLIVLLIVAIWLRRRLQKRK